jgi:hypothetical protein
MRTGDGLSVLALAFASRETLIGALSPPALVASLLDWHRTAYFDALAGLEAFLDRLDEVMLTRSAKQSLLSGVVEVRRRVSRKRPCSRGVSDCRELSDGLPSRCQSRSPAPPYRFVRCCKIRQRRERGWQPWRWRKRPRGKRQRQRRRSRRRKQLRQWCRSKPRWIWPVRAPCRRCRHGHHPWRKRHQPQAHRICSASCSRSRAGSSRASTGSAPDTLCEGTRHARQTTAGEVQPRCLRADRC